MRRVLIVDDNRDLRDTLKDYIEFYYDEIEISLASTGIEALEMYTSDNSFDVIISDEMMPIMTGSDFLMSIYDQLESTGTKALIYSGQNYEDLKSKLLQYPLVSIIDKISDPSVLRKYIDQSTCFN